METIHLYQCSTNMTCVLADFKSILKQQKITRCVITENAYIYSLHPCAFVKKNSAD